jgi:hypothetical protein
MFWSLHDCTQQPWCIWVWGSPYVIFWRFTTLCMRGSCYANGDPHMQIFTHHGDLVTWIPASCKQLPYMQTVSDWKIPMHMGIPICIRGSLYANMCIVWGSGDMNPHIYANNFAKNRVPVCLWGLPVCTRGFSPKNWHTRRDSPYAYGCCMHTVINI